MSVLAEDHHRYTLALQSLHLFFYYSYLFKQMKSTFLKKVAVLSAGAVVLSSVSFMGVNASNTTGSNTQQTILVGDCTSNLKIERTHEIDFGSFNTSEVAFGSVIKSGVKTGAENATSLSASPA
jgi:hypothetical protein